MKWEFVIVSFLIICVVGAMLPIDVIGRLKMIVN